MLSGWYLDVLVGYLLRMLIRTVKARGSNRWPLEKALITDSRVDRAAYGGRVAEVTYAFHHEGEYCSGMHREPFLLVDSAEEYVARFREGGDVIVRVRPGEPEMSIIRQRDQVIGI
jgi:hypothetical protein